MSFGDETGDYSSFYNDFKSVDSKKLNQKLIIEETYAEIRDVEREFRDSLTIKTSNDSGIAVSEASNELPEYAVVDLKKKREARLKKSLTNQEPKNDDLVIYEDIGNVGNVPRTTANNEDTNIYELVGRSN